MKLIKKTMKFSHSIKSRPWLNVRRRVRNEIREQVAVYIQNFIREQIWLQYRQRVHDTLKRPFKDPFHIWKERFEKLKEEKLRNYSK